MYNYTDEQKLIFDHIISGQHQVLAIQATAGSSKTTSLVAAIKRYKQIFPDASVRYLVFGNANAAEARSEFGTDAIASTLHAFAYHYVVKEYKLGAVKPFLTWRDLPKSIRRPFNSDGDIINLIEDYCSSNHLSLDSYATEQEELDPLFERRLLPAVKQFLNLMAQGKMPITHSFYLKLFHIFVMNDKIKLDHYERLLVDEFQDMSGLALDIIRAIPADQKVFVGDRCLIGSTKVLTDTGWRRLDSIVRSLENNKPVIVQSYNESTKTFEYKSAKNPQRTGIKTVYTVKGSKTTLTGTGNHKVLTSTGYTRIDELQPNAILLKYKNQATSGYSTTVNREQKQVLLGSFLGDGSIPYTSPHLKNNVFRLCLSHSKSQINYLLWKARAFKPDITISDLVFSKGGPRTIKGSTCTIQDSYSISTNSFVLESPITINSIEEIEPLGLAVWLMDDGSIKSKHQVTRTIQGITLSSNAFTKTENEYLQDILLNKFGLATKLGTDKEYFEINFNKENSHKLLKIVEPYISNDFTGKFKPYDTEVASIDSTLPEYIADSVISITMKEKQAETFDIEVEGNHNFIASGHGQQNHHTGVIVHNCQSIFEFLKLKDGFAEYPDAHTLKLSKSFRVSNHYAPAVQQYLQNNLDPDAVFVGMDYPADVKPVTKAYLTRTNAKLIAKMIKLNKSDTPYHLSSKTKLKQMFKLPLALIYAKPAFDQKDPELKHLQHDIDDWGSLSKSKKEQISLIKYLKDNNSHDSKLMSAITLILNFDRQDIINAYEHADDHKGKPCNLQLLTVHTSKGGTFDIVELDDDVNDAINEVLAIPPESRTIADRSELCTGFVACTRHRHQLINCKFI